MAHQRKADIQADKMELTVATQFPEIERLLETEEFDKINKSFTAAYEALEKISKGRGGVGGSSRNQAARKGMKAIERVMDLLRELLRLKYQIKGGESPPHIKK